MSVILSVRSDPGSAGPVGTSPPVRLDRGEIVVGRGAGAHLLLAGQAVSRRHCTVSGEGQNWRIVDSSSGGTFVNGARIAGPQFLRHGDVIRVGDSEIAVMLDQSALPSAAPSAPPPRSDGWGRPAGATQVSAATAPSGGQDSATLLLQGAGIARAQVAGSDQQVAAAAGAVLRAALAGLARLAQDRRKAREDLGVAAPADGDVPTSAEVLLLQLLAASPTDAAARVDALCAQIDAHQRAVLGAMQGSLHHALDQFSPAAIKTGARGDAEAWKVYERAFEAQEDGFVTVFAQALSKEYSDAATRFGQA